MSLLNAVNITCDELEATAGDILAMEHVVAAPLDDEGRHHLAKQLGVMRKRLETITRKLHEERRLG